MVTIILEETEFEEDFPNLSAKNSYFDKKLKKSQKPKPLGPINEPVPCEEHVFCAICEVKFDNYLNHVHSE